MRRRSGDDAAAFSALYGATSADVLAFLLRRCPTPEDAANCLAETFLIAWQKRDQLPPGRDSRAWLFGVARNTTRRSHERAGRAADTVQALVRELAAAGAVQPGPESPDPDPVLAALEQLTPIDQEILTLTSWEGLTPREIGAVLGMSPNLVRVRAHRARARLRSMLGRQVVSVEGEPAALYR
jgi:RNA polymerase sigma-70 factor, ECF subfamily